MKEISLSLAHDILEIIPNGIYIFQDGRFVFVNAEACRISGYSADELLSIDPFDLIADDQEKMELIRNTEKAMTGDFDGLPSEQEATIQCKNGEIKHISLRPLPIIYNGKQAIMTIVVDITEKVMEREKRKRLEEFVKLTGKMIRHDVLNNLSAVMGYLEMYNLVGDDLFLKKSIKSAERCIDSLKRLRELEWLIEEGNEMKRISLKEVFEGTSAGRDAEIKIKGNCIVHADNGIFSVAENLIENAIEHGGGGDISVTIERKGKWCEVRVADTGRGVSDGIKEKIFEEGFSSSGMGKGTGLFIVKRLMEKYGGEVWVENNKPSGAIFVLKFRSA